MDRALVLIHASPAAATVGGLLESLHCSRRALEKRFQAALGCGIHQEIVKRRVEAARRLLRETNLTVASVAGEAGFASAQRFYAAFAKLQGGTPGSYRRSYRG